MLYLLARALVCLRDFPVLKLVKPIARGPMKLRSLLLLLSQKGLSFELGGQREQSLEDGRVGRGERQSNATIAGHD
jgi:hypothetical protein